MILHKDSEVAAAAVDRLTDTQRALLCCVLGCTERRLLADQVARMTQEAILQGIVAGTPLRDAAQETLAVYLDAHVADINAEYHREKEAHRGALT